MSSSSPSYPPPSDEASIYLRARMIHEFNFYVINSETPEQVILDPMFNPPPESYRKSAFTVVGSTVYVIGGIKYDDEDFCHSLDDVYYIDVHGPKDGWKKGCSMNEPRAYPRAVAVNEKIYVMGSNKRGPWAEVFDPLCKDKGQSWRGLSGHPTDDETFRSVTGHTVLDGKRILVQCELLPDLYYYDTETDSCGVHAYKFGKRITRKSRTSIISSKLTFALVDGIMYVHDRTKPNTLFGFDLSKTDLPPKKVTGLESCLPRHLFYTLPEFYPPVCPHAFLSSVGNGKLVVVWGEPIFRQSEFLINVYCSKIAVSKKENAKGIIELTGHPISVSHYIIRGTSLVDGLVVFPSQKRESKDVSGDGDTTPTNKKYASPSSKDGGTTRSDNDSSNPCSSSLTSPSSNDSNNDSKNKKTKRKKKKNKNKRKKNKKKKNQGVE